MNRGSLVAALIVVFFSLRFLPPAAQGAPQPPASASPPPSPPLTDAGAPRATPPPPPDACARGRNLLEEYATLYGEPTDAGLEAARERFLNVVALVPDPIESGLAEDFDSVLEGIDEALSDGIAASRGGAGTEVPYVRDRSWLPWRGDDATKRANACWRTQPGVVLYRPTVGPDTHRAVAVWLVGETPAWGVRREAFEAALALADEHSDLEHRGTFWILGPTFSGSADSLAAALHRRALAPRDGGAPPHFEVSSGTATNPGVGDKLAARDPPGAAGGAATTGPPAAAARLPPMLLYLRARGGDTKDRPTANDPERPCTIDILSESQTGYGTTIGNSGKDRYDVCWNGVKFPPNLRTLREAYDALPGSTDGGLRAPLGSAAGAPASGNDLSGQTAAVHDLDLQEVLREVSEKRVRFVGILATDPDDIVFLAARIHEQLPDVQLFTLGSDMRFLHPDNSRAMNGVLVAHAGKAPKRSDQWSTVLESETVRNVYLAGRHLFTGEPAAHGPVVISLVGNGSFWQVGPDPDATVGPAPTDFGDALALPGNTRAPPSFTFVALLSALVFVGVAALVFAPCVTSWGWLRERLESVQTVGFLRHRGRLWGLIGPCEHQDLDAQDHLVTAALLCVTLCPPVLMVVSRFARSPAPRAHVALEVSIAALGIAVVLWSVSIFRGWRHADWGTRIITLLATVASGIALGIGCGPPREATYNLMSGGSAVLAALIALGIFSLGLWCWRVRLRFLDAHRFGRPAKGDPSFAKMNPPIAAALGGATGLAAIEARVMRVIDRPWTSYFAIPAAIHVLLGMSILWPAVIKPPHTFEPGWRNGLLVSLGCLALLPIVGNLSRLIATWVAFRRLLVRLAAWPGMAALERLPPRLARPLEAQLALSGSEIADLTCVLAALRPIATVRTDVETTYDACKTLLDDELRYEAGDPTIADDAGRRADLVKRLLDASSKLAGTGADGSQARAQCDDYTAALLAVFVPRYVRHFRVYIPPLIVGSVLAALMTSLYFIQPARLITSVIFVWVAGIVFSVFVVYVSLDRDPVIRAIGKRAGDSSSWNLALLRRVLTWGVFPLGSLLAAQYPDFAFRITSLLDELTKGFR